MRYTLAAVVLLFLGGHASAASITLTATQTGGFYADGIPDNFAGFQNYHVGYGTSGSGDRTSERRAFYWFEVPELDDPIVGAALTLTLAMPGGVVFGKAPGDPMAGPVPDDPFEVFQLSFTPFGPAMVTSPGLTAPESAMIFGSFAGSPTAAGVMFGGGAPPSPPDGSIVMPLNGLGLGLLSAALGGDLILTGFMPTWSGDSRPEPGGGPGDFFEAHELIFGLSDVHAGFPAPTLTIFTAETEPAPVPEPATGMLTLLGLGLIVRASRRRQARRGAAPARHRPR